MPTVKNRHHIQLELRGRRANISQPEYEPSPDEWHRRRTDAFARLRKSGGIPEEVIELVENFNERTPVELFVYRADEEVALRFRAKVLKSKKDKSKEAKTKQLDEMIAHGKRLRDEEKEKKKGMSASEALAFFLRIDLRALKQDEKEKKAAPVRTLNRVPRSLIAEIAMDMLGSCQTWDYPPGDFLCSLIRELLDLDNDRQGMSRDVDTQEKAASIIAQAPNVGTRELARALKVNASTISRWRRDPEFKKLVEQMAEVFKRSAETDEKIRDFAQKGPVQKETIALLLATAMQLYGPGKRRREPARR